MTDPKADERRADTQPAAGDIVLHCGHLGRDRTHHFIQVVGGVGFVRPDRTSGTAWGYVICDPCFVAAEGNMARVDIRGACVDDGRPLYVKRVE